MRILVSGAGIAGTALAFWAHHHGAQVTVVERAAALRDGGYKVDIRGAALDVIERMGLLEEVRARRTDVRTGTVVDHRGRRVASMDGDTFGGRVHGDAEVLRGDLQRLLYEWTAGVVEYRFGDAIAAIDDTRVTFESGDTQAFDVVVGADGLRSRTRALAFGGIDPVTDLGYGIAIGTVANDLGLDREEVTYVSPGRTTLLYSTAGQTAAKAMFLYKGEAALPEILASAPDLYRDTLSQVHLDRWSRGRVVLVGDAAYCASPASGQGTSLALVGAYVLAGELSRTDDLATAASRYEGEMRRFVERNQALGPANIKRMVLSTKAQVRVSMAMLALVNRLPGKERLMAKVIAPIHAAATAITLKKY
jgi:2-polyprenyl-6-methoxyphenol hydroxylase-like FAD-dependent oxidoreductase